MAGRPRASRYIVPIEELISDEKLINEKHSLLSIIPILNDIDQTLIWLAKRQLIRNHYVYSDEQRNPDCGYFED